jgi:transposase
MELVHTCCAGLDVHKKTVVACLRQAEPDGVATEQTATFGTMYGDLERLRDWLVAAGCTTVVMEATGVYWRPVFNVLESACSVVVVNPEHVKAVTGRKTDRQDARRLAHLLQYGLVSGSFIPEREQRELREVTRARTGLIRERARVVQRLDKTLETANIKLGAVLSQVLGASGQRMLEALLSGEEDPVALADLALGRARTKRAELEAALVGTLSRPLRFLVRQHLEHWRELDARIEQFDAEVAAVLSPFAAELAHLDTVPGIGQRTAEVLVAEIGPTVDRFPSARHLAAWAGVCPGSRESAGKRKPVRVRKGNPWVTEALVEAAWAATRKRQGYLPARYQRLAGRRGRKRALIALAHKLIVIVYELLTRKEDYRDLGGNYFDQRDREAVVRRSVTRLERLGYRVTVEAGATVAC